MVEFLVTQTASAPASTAETVRSVLIRDSLALHWTPWVRLEGLLLAERRPAEGCLARPNKGCTARKGSLLVCSELAVVSLCHNTMLRAIFACFAPAIRHSKTQKARNSKRGFQASFQATCGTGVRSVAFKTSCRQSLRGGRNLMLSLDFRPLPDWCVCVFVCVLLPSDSTVVASYHLQVQRGKPCNLQVISLNISVPNLSYI